MNQKDKLTEATMRALQGKLQENTKDETKFSNEIQELKDNAPKEFKYLSDNAYLYTPKNVYVELRPETVYDDIDEVYMDFAVFETEDDMNTDYEKNIGNEYHDILNPIEYWKFVADYTNAVVNNYNQDKSIKTESNELTWDDIYTRAMADDVGFGHPALKAKDNMRYAIEQLMEKEGIDIENSTDPEVDEEAYADAHNIKFDNDGNIISMDGKDWE